MPAAALRPLSVGEILDTSFQLYRRHFTPLATLVVVCYGVPLLVNAYVESAGGAAAHLGLVLLNLPLSIVLGSVAAAATVFVISEAYLGRGMTAREALLRATPFLGRLIVAALLLTLLVGLGFLLLIVPGVILACGLVLAWPALVLEDLPSATAGLRRSWALTRGARLKLFWLLVALSLILFIPYMALGVVVGIVAAVSGGAPAAGAAALVSAVLTALIQVVIYPLYNCVLTVAYYDLRVRKEGFDLEVLASTLQPA